jgi:hypothetical protein
VLDRTIARGGLNDDVQRAEVTALFEKARAVYAALR